AFYVWTTDEVQKILDVDDSRLAIKFFNLQPEGNYTDEVSGQRTGKNILHLTKPIAEWAAELEWSIESLQQKIEQIRSQLFNARSERERPFLDDKTLTDWNGLAIAALAKAGRVLGDPTYIEEAERAATFI